MSFALPDIFRTEFGPAGSGAVSRRFRHFYTFGPFRFDPERRVLSCAGKIVPLAPKLAEILLALVENHGGLVEKDELMQRIWPDTFVEEGNLTRNISRLRAALGEAPDEERYIQTLARRGYCFVAEVREIEEEITPAAERAPPARVELDAPEAIQGPAAEPQAQAGAARRTAPRWVWAAAGGAALLMLSAALVWWRGPLAPAFSADRIHSLAVLPFHSIGPADRDAYLGLGMADALISKLGGQGQVIVRSTGSARRFAGRGVDPQTAGRRLGVDAVLEGTLQRQGERLRLTVQLVEVESGRHLWSETFDQRFTDIFELEDSVSRRLAQALTLELSGAERRRLEKHDTDDPEAYADYLKGRYYASRLTRDGFDLGMRYFRQAIERDPSYARAYEGLAYYYIQANDLLIPAREAMPQARAAAQRALELDEGLPAPHVSLAMVHWQFDWTWPAAVRQFRRALELNPNHAETHQNFGFCLVMMGRFEEAIEQVRRARELDPLWVETNVHLSVVLYFARRYAEAAEVARRTIELDPHYWLGHVALGRALEQQGDLAQAIREYETARGIDDQIAEIEGDLGRAYARAGRTAEARAILDRFERQSQRTFVAPYNRAIILAALGETDAALDALEQAYRGRSWYMSWIKVDPALDRLRSHPRFEDLLRQVGLAPTLS